MNKKPESSKFLIDYLTRLNFAPDAIHLYQVLVEHGPLTLLEASRYSHLERTRLYRLVDSLNQQGLIEDVPEYRHRTIKAASFSTIEMMVKEKDLNSRTLVSTFPEFLTALQNLSCPTPKNNVIYYHGREGLRQMSWHILRAKGLYRTYSYRFWNEILGGKFTLRLNEEMVAQKMQVHDLFSDQYFKYKENWLKTQGHKPEGDWSWWHSRYISEKILKIDQNIDIYNDVVSYYHWQGEETFGLEIYDQRVADFHKQMHDLIWKMAKHTPHFDWTRNWK
jgi:hypothetical protein